MARIPIYTAERGLDTDRRGVPNVRVDQSLAGAIEGLGNAVSAAGQRFLQIQQEKEDFAAQVGYQKLQTQLGADLLDVDQNAAADGSGIHDGFMGRVGERRQGFLAGLPQRLQERYALMLDADAEAWGVKASEAELQRLRGHSITTIGQTINDEFLGQATKMPSVDALDVLIGDAESMIDAAPGLNAAEKEEQKRTARAALQRAWAEALPPELRADAVGVAPAAGAAPSGEPPVRRGDYDPVEYNAMRFYEGKGLSRLAAAAIAASFTTESGNRPGVVNSIGASGLAQWLGGRKTALMEFAAAQGKPWQDAGVQFEFALAEMTGDPRVPADAGAQRAFRELQAATTPEEAAAAMAHFERAEGYSPSNPQGIALWSKRLANTVRLSGMPAGAQPGGGGYTVGESRLDALPFDVRLAIARDAQSDMVAMQTAELRAQQAEHDRMLNDLMVGIIDGNVGEAEVAAARRSGWLTDAVEIDRALTEIEQRDKRTIEDRDAVQIVTTPGMAGNPYDTDARNLVDKGYGALGGAAGLVEENRGAGLSSGGVSQNAVANQRLDGVIANTGIVPKQAINALRAGLISTDLSAATQAFSTVARLAGKNARIFDPYDGGASLRDAAAAFTHLVDDRGLSPQEAVRQMQAMQTADRQQAEKLLGPAADDFVEELTPADVTAVFDPSGLPFGIGGGDPAAGYTPQMEAALMADYREIAREKFIETGDAGVAKSQAVAEMQRLYGVTHVGGQPALMKYPPENFYPPIEGSQDYLREAALAAAAEASGLGLSQPAPAGSAPGSPPSDGVTSAFLISTRETADDVRSGRPPRYRLFFTERRDGQSILREVQDSLFQMPAAEIRQRVEAISMGRAVGLSARQAETAAMAAREQAAREEAERAIMTMPTPGGPAMPVPPPQMSTGGRF